MTTRKQFWISFLIGIAVLVSGIFFVCIHQARAIIVLYRPGTPCVPIDTGFSANTNTVWNTLDVTSPAPASIIFTTKQMIADSQGNQFFTTAISTAGDGNYNLVNAFGYLYEVPGVYVPTLILDYTGGLPAAPCTLSITSTLPYKIVVTGTNTGSFIVQPPTSYHVNVCSNSSIPEVFTLSNLTAIPIVGGTVTFNNGTDYSILAGATFTMLGSPATTNITIQLAPTRTGSYSTEVIFAATGVDSKTGLFTAVSLSNSLAAFSSNITNGPAPLAVLFTNRTLAGTWTNSNWDFGDGTTAAGITPANPVLAHTYPTSGTYAVSLTVFGLCSSGSATYNIGVSCSNQLNVLFASNATSGSSPLTVTFANNSVGGTNFNWNFGDGSTSNALTNALVTHTFSSTTNVIDLVTLSGFGVCSNSSASTNISVTVVSCSNCNASVTQSNVVLAGANCADTYAFDSCGVVDNGGNPNDWAWLGGITVHFVPGSTNRYNIVNDCGGGQSFDATNITLSCVGGALCGIATNNVPDGTPGATMTFGGGVCP